MKALFTRFSKSLENIQQGNYSCFGQWIETCDALLLKHLRDKGLLTGREFHNSFFNLINTKTESFGSGVPFVRITSRSEVEIGSNDLVGILLNACKDIKTKQDIKTCFDYVITEILNNVADHSGDSGIAIAQYYPTKKRVQFSALDNGVGFLANIQNKFPNIKTQDEAIKKALERGVTASQNLMYGSERNAGYGLFVVSSLVKEIQNSELLILCKDTLISIRQDRIYHKHLSNDFGCTLICFEIDEESLKSLDYDIDVIIGQITYSEKSDIEDIFL